MTAAILSYCAFFLMKCLCLNWNRTQKWLHAHRTHWLVDCWVYGLSLLQRNNSNNQNITTHVYMYWCWSFIFIGFVAISSCMHTVRLNSLLIYLLHWINMTGKKSLNLWIDQQALQCQYSQYSGHIFSKLWSMKYYIISNFVNIDCKLFLQIIRIFDCSDLVRYVCLFVCLFDWFDWLLDWLIDWLIDWLLDW